MGTIDTPVFGAAKNFFLSCVLCFCTGLIYSLGVFSISVENSANPPGSLDGSWSAGMGWLSLFCIPSLFYAGVYLSEGSEDSCSDSDCFGTSKTIRVRILCAIGSLAYASLAFAGYGVATSSAPYIQLAFSVLGIGMGLLYLEAMELLSAWAPSRPGMAVGVGQMMFGLGTIIGSSTFSYLIRTFPCDQAIYITAAILAIPTAIATPFLEWPPLSLSHPDERDAHRPLTQRTHPLSWKQLAYLPSFWMYVTTIFCLQAGYAFMAYYFKIGKTFGRDMTTVVFAFQVASIAATLFRPLTGALVDVMKSKEGFFALGSKNMGMVLLASQTICFLGLIPATYMNSFEAFAGLTGGILTIFAAGACCGPLMAREQFGAINSSVVYGAGGSISMGLGETVAVVMMAAFEGFSKSNGPAAYQVYYAASVLWSIIGFVVVILLKEEKHDFKEVKETIESPWTPAAVSVVVQAQTGDDCRVFAGYTYGAIDPPLRSVEVC